MPSASDAKRTPIPLSIIRTSAPFYEIGEHDGQLFIAMQHLEGETLKHRIEGRPLKTDILLDLAIQIANALNAAHSRVMIHVSAGEGAAERQRFIFQAAWYNIQRIAS